MQTPLLKSRDKWPRGVKSNRQLNQELKAMDSSDYGMHHMEFDLIFFYRHAESNACLHRAATSKGPSPVSAKDMIMLHNVGQKYIAEKIEGPFWICHAQIKTLQPKFKEYFEQVERRRTGRTTTWPSSFRFSTARSTKGGRRITRAPFMSTRL